MPATKKLSDQQIDALMREFAARRVRVPAFCAERGLAVPTFRRWKRALAWMPPMDVAGYLKSSLASRPF